MTDILGSNRVGLDGILVKAIKKKKLKNGIQNLIEKEKKMF